MKLKLSDVQVEQVGVTCLDQLHFDLKQEIYANDLDPYLDSDDLVAMIRTVISVEVIMQELMHPTVYELWKRENGIEL